jgi:hypothetical protein
MPRSAARHAGASRGRRCLDSRNADINLRAEDAERAFRHASPLRRWLAKQVAGDVEKSEAPTLLRERLEIRLDEKPRWSRRWHKSRHEQARRQSQPRGVVRSLLE